MARRFGSLSPLRDVDADGESDAVAKVIQALVGGAAYLFELVAGHAVSTDSQVTPPNPQGEIGIDLSGPPWGSAIRHPIAWMGGAKPDVTIAYGMSSVIRVPVDVRAVVGPWLIWVRPFENLPGTAVAPYSLGEILVRGHEEVLMAATVDIDVRNLSISSSPMTYAQAYQFASGSTAEASYTMLGTAAQIRLVPGWNVIEIGFSHNGTEAFIVDSIVINQVVKRTH